MTRTRAIVLVFLAVVAGVALLVPVAREEVDWYWAEFQDQAPDYNGYLTDWPNGHHANEARNLYDQRRWAAAKRALIRQAYQQTTLSNSSPDSDAAYRGERLLRREVLFWKQATNVNSIDSYNNYLQQYPQGRYADKARSQMEKLGQAPPP